MSLFHRLLPLALLLPVARGNPKNGLEGEYLMISAPRLSKVVYMKLGKGSDKAIRPLVESGLESPQGLAVCQLQAAEKAVPSKLYVADPDQRSIFKWDITGKDGVLSVASNRTLAVGNVESRWVAVDKAGNLFFTDERSNLVMKLSNEKMLRGEHKPNVLYSSPAIPQVSNPGGIALDNFHLFWTNKALGTELGSVVRGLEAPAQTNLASSVRPVAMNSNKVYGVCASANNLFYTDQKANIYGVKKNGGEITIVSNKLLQPRGCVWDGDGTMYVADKSVGSVYSFPGNMEKPSTVRLLKTLDFEDAFGLAVVSASVRAGARGLAALLGVAAAAVLLPAPRR